MKIYENICLYALKGNGEVYLLIRIYGCYVQQKSTILSNSRDAHPPNTLVKVSDLVTPHEQNTTSLLKSEVPMENIRFLTHDRYSRYLLTCYIRTVTTLTCGLGGMKHHLWSRRIRRYWWDEKPYCKPARPRKSCAEVV